MESLRALLQPLVFLWLLSLVLLISLWRRRQDHKRRLALLTGLYAALTLLCVPAVNFLALRSLEWRYPPLVQRPNDVDAIVVLAGGMFAPEGEGRPPLPSDDTLYRCLRAVEMYRQGRPCLVVVSGGPPPADQPLPTLSRVMRDFLVSQGVAAGDIVEECDSLTTYDNAVGSAKILRERNLSRVLLVTSAYHLERAVRCFRKQGIDVVPCGCQYGSLEFEPRLARFLPDPPASWGVAAACHEWLGLAWYALHNRI
jgi:uncharacterized SAM-binding protein YcdF (DUF218 family)